MNGITQDFILKIIIDEMWNSGEIYSNQRNRDDGLVENCYYYDAIVKTKLGNIVFTQTNEFEKRPDIYNEYKNIDNEIEKLKKFKNYINMKFYEYKEFIIIIIDGIGNKYTKVIKNKLGGNKVKEIFIDFEKIYDKVKKEEIKQIILYNDIEGFYL